MCVFGDIDIAVTDDVVVEVSGKSSCENEFIVVTGRGCHSHNGIARLRPAVIAFLNSNHYQYVTLCIIMSYYIATLLSREHMTDKCRPTLSANSVGRQMLVVCVEMSADFRVGRHCWPTKIVCQKIRKTPDTCRANEAL